MAQARQKSAGPQDARVRASRPPRSEYLSEASGVEASSLSPALGLQSRLGDAFTAQSGASKGRRWSPRATILLSSGVALTLWLAIAAGVWAISRAF
jgi:hypothetical protein